MPPRVKPRPLNFRATWAATTEELRGVVWELGFSDFIVECEAGRRGYGYDRTFANADMRRVVLRYVEDEKPIELTSDTQETPAGNLRALYLALESRRLNIVRGVDDIVRAQYLALAAPKLARDPYEVLGLRPDASAEDIESQFRTRAKRLHPDVEGGSDEAFADLAAAKDEALRRLGA